MTNFGPCQTWDPIWTCTVAAQSPAATGAAVQAATEILWAMSGRQYGTCEVTHRPCRRDCYDRYAWSNLSASWLTTWTGPGYLGAGGYYTPWFDLECGSCNGGCSCSRVSEVALPAPVSSITNVMMDGSVLGPSAYRVDDNRLLVRTDGHVWPRCNDLSKNDSQPGTWSVTAVYGQEVPVSGQLAVGELACEILRAMSGEDCRLPAGLKSLARQGVNIELPSPGELFADGKTGLYLSDAFIQSVNPHRLARRSRVYSVDHRGPRRAGT